MEEQQQKQLSERDLRAQKRNAIKRKQEEDEQEFVKKNEQDEEMLLDPEVLQEIFQNEDLELKVKQLEQTIKQLQDELNNSRNMKNFYDNMINEQNNTILYYIRELRFSESVIEEKNEKINRLIIGRKSVNNRLLKMNETFKKIKCEVIKIRL